MSNRSWVTLATNDSYGLGALVLAHSLRRTGSIYPATVLITPSVTDAMRERLHAVFAEVVTVDVLDSRDAAHLALLQRPELGITFTKIHCWELTQYEKCVFLDADTLVVQNCDELFEREELSAAPDVGWPDCFNSGVFVYKPSQETFQKLIKFAEERGSFDGGDQGLLNAFFSDWAQKDINKHLPFVYNVTSVAFYSYLPALKYYGQNLKIIHFIGAAKPWLQQFNWESRSVDAPEHLREFLQLWWDLFVGQVHSQLNVSMSGVAGNLARVVPGAASTQREVLDELTRRQGWEAGNIDYLGADSFDNIWAKISQTLSKPRTSPPKQPSPPKEVPVEVAQEASAVDAALAAAVETSLEISGGEPIAIKTPEAPVEATPAVETNVAGDVAPGSIEAAPAGAEPVSPASVESSPAPVEVSSAPVEVASAPVESEKGSVQADPASAVSATVEAATVPVETGTVSVEAASAPTEPASVEIAPVPVEATSTPVEVVPVEAAPAAAPIEPSTEKPVQVEISKAAEATLTTETPAAIETKLPEAKTTEATAPVKVPTAVEAATASIPAAVPAAEIPATVEAVISVPQVESEIPATVGVCAPGEAPVPVEAKSETPEATAKSEPTLPLIQPASPKSSEEPVQSALPVQPVEVAKETVPVVPEPSLACPVSPKAMQPAATPEKSSEVPVGSDSPPLANTPSKDEVPKLPAAKSTEEAAQETRL